MVNNMNEKPPMMLGDRIEMVLRKTRRPMTRLAIAKALKLFRQQIVVALSLPKYRDRFIVDGERVTLRPRRRKVAKARKTAKQRKATPARKTAVRKKPASKKRAVAKPRKPARRKRG
jgi:hypothetical protein